MEKKIDDVIKCNYIIMYTMSWTDGEMLPLCTTELLFDAETIARIWTQEQYHWTKTTYNAGIYSAKTGKLIAGYSNGERIELPKRQNETLTMDDESDS